MHVACSWASISTQKLLCGLKLQENILNMDPESEKAAMFLTLSMYIYMYICPCVHFSHCLFIT